VIKVINLLRVFVNRLQSKPVSCDSYYAQGKLGGVDGKVIWGATMLALEVMNHMRVDVMKPELM